MSKRFIGFLLGIFLLTALAFFYTLYQGFQAPRSAGTPAGTANAPAQNAAPQTSVTLSIEKTAKGNVLLVQWSNLPGETAALDIFRSTKGKSDWALWKTILLTPEKLGAGTAEFNIGDATFANYSFYIEAIGNGGGGGGANATTTILWTSPPVDAPIATTTTSTGGSTPPSNPGENPTPTSSAPTSSTPVSNPTSTAPQSGTTSSPAAPTGTPYYTPQIKISGYGTEQSGNFWVQHIDQKIQIGWQNLPPQTTGVAILRSPAAAGPWTAVLTQENPNVASYSIQIVDDTLGQGYYYEMNAYAGSTTDATYGPIYLPPVGQ